MSDETTSEQIAEIEGQHPEPEPQAEYIPPKGWRALQPGEALQPGDAWHHPQANLFEADLNLTGVAGSHGYYLRRQVCEGRWCTRGGEIRNVTPTPDGDSRAIRYPWHDARCDQTWLSSGRYHTCHTESPLDLWEYLGAIEQPEPQPQPEPQQAPQAETDFELRIRVLRQCNDNQAETIGRLNGEIRDLRTELAEATQERDAQAARIGHLETINSTHAETISGLHSEIHGLNMEIGGLERQLSGRQARIQDLETMHAAATQAVVDAGKQNDKLRNLANNLRQQFEAAANEISEQRSYLDKYEKQLDQKDAQIRDLRIELDAAQQVVQPLTDEQQELIWDQATQEAGEQLIRWLHPLVHALKQQPNERFLSFMAITLSVLPDIVPAVLGYEEEEGESAEE